MKQYTTVSFVYFKKTPFIPDDEFLNQNSYLITIWLVLKKNFYTQ